MKICFMIRQMNQGGAQWQLLEIVRPLAKLGYQVLVITFYSGGEFAETLSSIPDVKWISLEKKNRWDLFAFFRRFFRVIRAEKPDALHTYLGMANVFSIMIKPFFPKMRVIWGVRNSRHDIKAGDWADGIGFFLERRFSRFADLIIANSRAGKNFYVSKGFPERKTTVIYNGIDSRKFFPDPAARLRIRGEWGIQDDDILIAAVGRLDPVKNFPGFLAAAISIAKRFANAKFAIVGGGSKELPAMLASMPGGLSLRERFIFPGSAGNMPAVYNAFDIFISTSVSEGFSNVVGEAMATGLQCIATDVGDTAMLMGGIGLVIPARDDKAIEKALDFTLRTKRETWGLGARERVAAEFSVERMVQKTVGEIERILDPRKSGSNPKPPS